MPPIDYREFKRIVKEQGCLIEELTQHVSKIYKEGLFISSFARTHKKGGKRDQILPCYQKLFWEGLAKADRELKNHEKTKGDS